MGCWGSEGTVDFGSGANLDCNFRLDRVCIRVHAEELVDHFYSALLWRAFWLILVGLLGLTVVIPFSAKLFSDSPAKTEFHSVRLANLCVMVGVLIWGLALVGALVEHLLHDFAIGAK